MQEKCFFHLHGVSIIEIHCQSSKSFGDCVMNVKKMRFADSTAERKPNVLWRYCIRAFQILREAFSTTMKLCRSSCDNVYIYRDIILRSDMILNFTVLAVSEIIIKKRSYNLHVPLKSRRFQ